MSNTAASSNEVAGMACADTLPGTCVCVDRLGTCVLDRLGTEVRG